MGFHFSPKIVTNGLVLYYDAKNPQSYIGTGVIVNNLIDNNINGTLINGTITNTNDGFFTFDGVNDYIQAPNSSIITFQNNFTLSAWVRTRGSNPSILSKRNAATFINNYQLFMSTSSITLQINGNSSIGVSGSFPATNGWIYLTATVTPTSLMKVYANGLFLNSNQGPTGIITDVSPLRIGQNHDLNQPFNGDIGLVKIYNRELTPQEISQNYNAMRKRFGL